MNLNTLMGRLNGGPNVIDHDLAAVNLFIEAVSAIFPVTRKGVYVERAVIELTNETGYPVGHILFTSEDELYRFVPHSDDQDKEV